MTYSEYEISEINRMLKEGYTLDFISDWKKMNEETGLDLRDMADGVDVDEFLDILEDENLSEEERYDLLFDMI
jgi:hypothetical protein